MKSNQNEFKSNSDIIALKLLKIDEKWDKNKNNGFGVDGQKLTENSEKIDQNHQISTQKVDTNWNNGFGLGPQNLIIKSTQIGQFWEKINENWMKFQVKIQRKLSYFSLKIN